MQARRLVLADLADVGCAESHESKTKLFSALANSFSKSSCALSRGDSEDLNLRARGGAPGVPEAAKPGTQRLQHPADALGRNAYLASRHKLATKCLPCKKKRPPCQKKPPRNLEGSKRLPIS